MKKTPFIAGAILGFLFCGKALEAQIPDAASRVAVLGFVNETGDARYDTVADTATDSLRLTLNILNCFHVAREKTPSKNDETCLDKEALAASCAAGQYDYAIIGAIRKGHDDALDCELSVFRAEDGTLPVSRTERNISLLGIFAATDRLVDGVLETITGEHVGYGTLMLHASGSGDYSVELDGFPAGKNISAMPRVVAGTHHVLVRQGNKETARTILDTTENITEGLIADVSFSLDAFPAEIPGEVLYIPFPVSIAIDGDISDWAGIPSQKVSSGPKKSPDSRQTPYYDFSVAADERNLYFRMHVVDSKIITKQHGKDFWNEDSLEFYFNLSGDLSAKQYKQGIVQININPGDIGAKDLTITGVNSDRVKVTGKVFKTNDGWGFEASVPLGKIVPEHGLTIGIQTHANGATATDRDSKLIWSKADKNDGSWGDPSLFGKAVFFKVGSTDVPAAK